jgi:hypothetical protein
MCVTIVGVCDMCKRGFSGRTQYCYKGMDGIVCVDPTKIRRRMVGPINTTTMDGSYINMLEVTRTETFSGVCDRCGPRPSKKRKIRE